MSEDCVRHHQRLSALADGELAGAEREAVERHLQACAECRALLARWRRLDGKIGELAPPPVSGERWARMESEIKRAVRERGAVRTEARLVPAPRPGARTWVLALAAAAGLLLAATLLSRQRARAGRDYASAESIAIDAAGENCQTVVMTAPEGGLNLVIITRNEPEAATEERAGG